MKRWRLPLLFVLLGVFFAACFTIETQERELGMSREARLNPWLAAGRVLERNRVTVRFAPEYVRLPPRARVLVLATPLEYLDAAEQRDLLDWVKRGGHLVTELQDDSDDGETSASLLARELDVRLVVRELDDKELAAMAEERSLRATTLQGDGVLQAGFDHDLSLRHGKQQPLWQAADRYGAHALRFTVGQGRITVVSDLYWMQNRRLDDGDHAGLLWRVVDARAGDQAWLVHGTERPSLLSLLWEQAAPFFIALAVFIAAWLWSVSRRFGPLLGTEAAPRRRLAEHLEAAGRYLMRHGGLKTLFDSSRQRLLAHVQRRYPQWRRLPPAELAEHLAERARIESAAVLRLLETGEPKHILQFAADIRLINRLRKAL
ncbi:MAG: hypothetical protein K0S46_271 [Moraxellaceae bacterium]|jgi:hypothetical protein|nr:hypothetical protein [Moraxellaceae bacterium]